MFSGPNSIEVFQFVRLMRTRLTLGLVNAGEAMKAPNSTNRRSQIVRFIRATVAILIEVRVLAAELMFTAAALYACYIAFQFLIHRLL